MKETLQRVYATLILAAGFFALTACTTDDNTGTEPKEFPTLANLSVKIGDTGSIEFKAYATWTLSSDKPNWFKLDSDTGKAGDQKIGYTVTDDGIGFEDDFTTITLSMGGKDATFKATRTANERFLKFYKLNVEDYSWIETKSLDLAFATNAKTYNLGFKVVANYDWKLTVPDWITIDPDHTSGSANPTANPIEDPNSTPTAWVSVNYAKATAEDMSGKFVFTDSKISTAALDVTATCPGSNDYLIANAAFSVAMTPDGKYIAKVFNPETGLEEEVIKDSYEFSLIAGHNEITIFKVWKEGGFYGVDPYGMGTLQYKASWCGVDPLPAKDKVLGAAVTEFGYEIWCNSIGNATRTATIIVMPSSKAVGLKEQDMVASNEQDIKAEYQQYIVTDVTQELSKGLAFAYPQYVYDITLAQMPDGDELDGLKSEYGVEQAYTLTYNSFESAMMASLKIMGYDLQQIITSFVPASAELNTNTGTGWLGFELSEYATVSISDKYIPFTGSRNALIIFKSEDTQMGLLALKVVQNVANPASAE